MTNATDTDLTLPTMLALATKAAIQHAGLVRGNIADRREAGQDPTEWADCRVETVACFGLLDSLGYDMEQAHGRKATPAEVDCFMSLYSVAAKAAAEANGLEHTDHVYREANID